MKILSSPQLAYDKLLQPNPAMVLRMNVGRDRLQRYWLRYRTRRQLARLSAEQLRDIGLTVEQAYRESQVPFWR